ncbi:MAG: hypothetical protein ACI8WB_002938 [Phenylobacterium sp.]|jgi:hypothetical protein
MTTDQTPESPKQLRQLQQQMINYLTDNGASSIISHIVSQGNIDNHTRLHIYKNAYQARLKEVIDTDHNLLGMYLGDDLFDQMVSEYIQAYPSQHTSLRNYADQLPAFLTQQPPFCDHPIISEIARFERLLLSAFDAPDAPRFDHQSINQIPAEDWPNLTFRFHPSVQLIKLNTNAVESWQALKAEMAPDPATAQQSCWLLWRNGDRLTEFRSLSHEEETLINMILGGDNFSVLCEFLLTNHSPETVGQVAMGYLSDWIGQGLLRQG